MGFKGFTRVLFLLVEVQVTRHVQPFALVHTSFSEDLFYLYCRFFGMRSCQQTGLVGRSTVITIIIEVAYGIATGDYLVDKRIIKNRDGYALTG
jgi:hypothetical protein